MIALQSSVLYFEDHTFSPGHSDAVTKALACGIWI
jgi:hypothetical protein